MIYYAYWHPDWIMRSELGCSLVNCGTELVGFIVNQISVEATKYIHITRLSSNEQLLVVTGCERLAG